MTTINNEIPLSELWTWLNLASHGDNAETAIESAIAIHLAAAATIESYKEAQEQARQLVAKAMAETGQTSFTTKAGKAIITAPSTTVAYDAKALDVICATNPTVNRLLAPYRKQNVRPGSLRITAAK